MSLADTYPEHILFLTVDGMDQKKTQLPHQSRPTKDVEGKGEALQAKVTVALIRGYFHGIYNAWTLPNHETGSDYVITVINRVLCLVEDFYINTGASTGLPPVLFLQLDNCGKENKNQYLIKYLGCLVKLHVFSRIEVHFLLVGHTHTQVDQAISVLSRSFGPQTLSTLQDMMDAADKLFPDMTIRLNERVSDIWDAKQLTDDICHKFTGLGTVRDPRTNEKVSLHSLRIELVGEEVLLFYKEFDDSSSWLGKWDDNDAGIKIFLRQDCDVPDPSPGTLRQVPHTLHHQSCLFTCTINYACSLFHSKLRSCSYTR